MEKGESNNLRSGVVRGGVYRIITNMMVLVSLHSSGLKYFR